MVRAAIDNADPEDTVQPGGHAPRCCASPSTHKWLVR